MQHFSKVEIKSLSGKTCDRCDRSAELDDAEFQEFLSINRVVGFGSVFGDGELIQLDLCQHCVKDVLFQWVKLDKID